MTALLGPLRHLRMRNALLMVLVVVLLLLVMVSHVAALVFLKARAPLPSLPHHFIIA